MLYKFIDRQGTFTVRDPQQTPFLYFPLTNARGTLLSSITPSLAGDIKKDNSSFLMPPASVEDLRHNLLCRRDFFLATGKTGTVIRCSQPADDRLEAGFLYHRLIKKTGPFSIEITNFVPHDIDAEVMWIKVKNVSSSEKEFTPTSFIPLYGRGEATVHDHRHVSSLLNRVTLSAYGITLKPTMIFDETGHRKNDLYYFVLGYEGKKIPPRGQFPTLETFCGNAGGLERPRAVYGGLHPFTKKISRFDGKEACAAFRFRKKILKKNGEAHYVLIAGVGSGSARQASVFTRLDSPEKVGAALEATRKYWQDYLTMPDCRFNLPDYDNWLKWVQMQPTLRNLFGCSFLPHFDYGKGGRGFRDLWQDILSLLLRDEDDIRSLMLNNFKSIRIDGSNATIITREGKFIADRNRITRVWTDHGVWPVLSTALYIHRSGDTGILLKKVPYFKDCQLMRAREYDGAATEKDSRLRTHDGKIYEGTVLEHLLIENIVQFFNVGRHNILRLENGDWNDGLDMAPEQGESVPFYCMYASNLLVLCDLLRELKKTHGHVELLQELLLLLDTLYAPARYRSIKEKTAILNTYMEKTKRSVSGMTTAVDVDALIADLTKKARWIFTHVRKQEWMECGFYNGYYDNKGRRVEGCDRKGSRMLLQSQVFPLLSGAATPAQTGKIWRSVTRLLKDNALHGYRLNTDFKTLLPDLGRAFGFCYGDKENGAFFNHMIVMLSYALYAQEKTKEAQTVLDSLYSMSSGTQAGIYPMLPEYFNRQGQGLYFYLTGSASWYIYTLFEQVLGIRFRWGDLLLSPKLTARSFHSGPVRVSFSLAGKKISVEYTRSGTTRKYVPGKAFLDEKPLPLQDNSVVIDRAALKKLSGKTTHHILVNLI